MNSLEHPQSLDINMQARKIACGLEMSVRKEQPQGLRVSKILNELKNENLLGSEIIRVKSLFSEKLKNFSNDFGEDCWEMLTVLELFDEETAIHCVNTYLIAKSKAEKKLWNGIILADEFKKEDVTITQFYRACLLHDIGKIEVPHSVLVNRVTDENCSDILFANKEEILIPSLKKKFGEDYTLSDDIKNGESLLSYLHNELHLRPQTLTPVKLLLDKPIKEKIISQLAHCGCSIDDSLLKIMRTHDEYSKKILQGAGFEIEGELAGSHHVNKDDSVKYKITAGVMQVTIDLADILHLADVQNAILSKRYYKEEKTPLDALKILSLHSKQGFIKSYSAYIWISDEMNGIKRDELEDKDKENFDFVAKFLDEEYSKHQDWSDWKV